MKTLKAIGTPTLVVLFVTLLIAFCLYANPFSFIGDILTYGSEMEKLYGDLESLIETHNWIMSQYDEAWGEHRNAVNELEAMEIEAATAWQDYNNAVQIVAECETSMKDLLAEISDLSPSDPQRNELWGQYYVYRDMKEAETENAAAAEKVIERTSLLLPLRRMTVKNTGEKVAAWEGHLEISGDRIAAKNAEIERIRAILQPMIDAAIEEHVRTSHSGSGEIDNDHSHTGP